MPLRNAIVVLALSILVSCQGCYWAFVKRHTTSDHRVVPEDLGGWFPSQAQTAGSTLLRYDCLYVCEDRGVDGVLRRYYFRFWPNGRVMGSDWWRVSDKELTGLDGDEFRSKIVGRYCVLDHEILIELYDLTGRDWYYVTLSGAIDPAGDVILTQEQWGRARPGQQPPRKLDMMCRRKIVGPMNREPDW